MFEFEVDRIHLPFIVNEAGEIAERVTHIRARDIGPGLLRQICRLVALEQLVQLGCNARLHTSTAGI